MQARLDVVSISEELVESIVNHREDPRLKWNKDGTVTISIGKVLPKDSAVKQTLEGRRRRFRQEVERKLTENGWRKIKANVYSPPAT